MKKILYLFKPSQENLFSACNTMLGIFILMHYRVEFGLLFMVLVALFTIAMDLVFKWCK
jgi:hypothetical protein